MCKIQKHVRRLTVKACSEDYASRYCVWVDVGCWATVLHVPLAIFGSLRGDANRCTAICDSCAELGDLRGLVLPCQTHCVVLAVHCNVLLVAFAELLDGSVDILQSSLCAHLFGGVVGVTSCSVPVSWHGLRVEGHYHAEFLSESVHDVARDPQVVTDFYAQAWAHLVLPLARHDLRVDSSDLDPCIQACSVVCLNEGASECLISPSTAVIGSLGSGVTSSGPPERGVIESVEGVFLFNAEPGLEVLGLLEDIIRGCSSVGREWCAIGFVADLLSKEK
jgi:hypothetical protein